MKLFGPTAELTEIAKLIMTENIDALENEVSNGFDINKQFQITERITETPITLALCENKKKVIDWLLSKNVELNDKDNPAILMACSNCDIGTVRTLIKKGANVNAKHRIGKTAMNSTLYGNNYEIISLLIDSGYDIKKDGSSFRQAVSNRQKKAIEIFLNNKIDVNFCKPDMVFPYNSTPVHIATKNNDIETVKLLVEKGADITIKDKYGERPYNCAVANGNEELKVYLRALEPEKWHDEEQKIIDLKSYKIPTELLTILRNENRRIEMPENENIKEIEFSSLLDVKEVNWQKRKFLDLLSYSDNYGNDGLLVWYPKKKCLAFADYEHDEFKELCSMKEFLENPSKQIDKIFE